MNRSSNNFAANSCVNHKDYSILVLDKLTRQSILRTYSNPAEQVDSPNEARAYGTGELIVINVVFSQDVTLEGDPTLVLETGVFNQEVCFRVLFVLAH